MAECAFLCQLMSVSTFSGIATVHSIKKWTVHRCLNAHTYTHFTTKRFFKNARTCYVYDPFENRPIGVYTPIVEGVNGKGIVVKHAKV